MASISGTLSSPGIGSGLDVNSIVSQLMAIESRPLAQFDSKTSDYNSKISSLGLIKSALSSLQDAAKALSDPTSTAPLNASFSDSTIGSATATTFAAPGSYAINVTSLASANKIISGTFANPTTDPIGNIGDTLTIGVGTKSTNINITGSNNSLAGIRSAINNAHAGVTATIVNGSNGAQLIVTADDSGSANQITLSGVTSLNFDPTQLTDGNGNPNPANKFSILTPASDASLTIDGVTVTSSGNQVSDAIDGVTLNLTSKGATTLNVAHDNAALKTAVDAFVSAFNGVDSNIDKATKYNTDTKQDSPLTGDSQVRNIKNSVRNALAYPLTGTGTYSLLTQLGISINKNGVMSVDSSKFQKAVSTDLSSVISVLAGYGKQIAKVTDQSAGPGGSIDSRTTSINAMIRDVAQQKDEFQTRLDATQARYTKQFSSLDSIISGMQSTMSFLTKQLASL